jgi:hypothetical protein
MPNAT